MIYTGLRIICYFKIIIFKLLNPKNWFYVVGVFNRKGEKLGEKDILEKKLLMFNDIFATSVNGIMFDGEQVVKEDELLDVPSWSQYKGDDSRHRFQDRDVVKLWKKQGIVISLIGIENQDIPDEDMVFRILSYDGASYRTQLAEKAGRKRRNFESAKNIEIEEKSDIFPVITFVIYYGEEEWKHKITLCERLKLEGTITKYVSDYKVNLIDLKKMTEDDINKFKKDFRLLADYLVNGSNHTSESTELNHPEEICELILKLTGEIVTIPEESEEGGKSMEKFFEPMFERAEARGVEKGENCLAKLISLLLSEGKNDAVKDALENEEKRHELYKEYGIC